MPSTDPRFPRICVTATLIASTPAAITARMSSELDDWDAPSEPMTATAPSEPLQKPLVQQYNWADAEAERDAEIEAFALQKLKQKNCTEKHDDYCSSCGFRKPLTTQKTKYADFYSQY